MNETRQHLVSRAQLARYAEVSRAAVTNWRKRGPDFPEPADTEKELFDLDQIVDWLSARAIPANARHPHEPVGTTYADRVRASAGIQDAGELPLPTAPDDGAGSSKETDREVERLLRHALDGLRGYLSPFESCCFLLDLLYVRARQAKVWRDMLSLSESPDGLGVLPQEVEAAVSPLSRFFLPVLVPEHLHETFTDIALIGSGDDRQRRLATAFDQVLVFLEESRDTGILRTPEDLVETVIGLLLTDATPRHVHDPFCRTGEFLIAADRRLRADRPFARHRLSGTDEPVRDIRTARMNLDVHGVEVDLREGPTVPGSLPVLPQADVIVTNPPFNQLWRPAADPSPLDPPPHWHGLDLPYGDPPESNANFAWLQSIVAALAPEGRAGVLMPTNAAFSENRDERSIRSAMIEDGAVEGVVAFPASLFPSTGIPVSLWLLRRPTRRCDGVLFIDASDLGTMVSRTRRALRPQDIDTIHAVHRSWRHEGALGDEWSGVGRVVGIDEIRNRDHSLHPPSYITADSDPEETRAQEAERFGQLAHQLASLEARAPETDARVRGLLREVHRWVP